MFFGGKELKDNIMIAHSNLLDKVVVQAAIKSNN